MFLLTATQRGVCGGFVNPEDFAVSVYEDVNMGGVYVRKDKCECVHCELLNCTVLSED